MDCTKCKFKGCRKSEPCFNSSNEYLNEYLSPEIQVYTEKASKLVDNGRAGVLTRIDEIAEYCSLSGYTSVGIAYCYGMEKEAF